MATSTREFVFKLTFAGGRVKEITVLGPSRKGAFVKAKKWGEYAGWGEVESVELTDMNPVEEPTPCAP